VAPRTVLLGAAVLLVALAMATPPAAGQVPLVLALTGPASLAPGQTAAYNLTLSGGPTGAVTYTVRWHVEGPDAAGALPPASNPTSETHNATAFQLNITAPPRDTDVTLVVSVSAQVGTTSENASVEKSIVVITPILLSATFRNDGTTAAVNVTVRFYVDDGLVGSQKIARIDSHAQATASFNYLPIGMQPGTHRVRIEADLDGNGIIDSSRGEAFASDLFYRTTPGLGTGWTVAIGIAVFLPVLIATVAVRRRERA